jgi:hypothetical protein
LSTDCYIDFGPDDDGPFIRIGHLGQLNGEFGVIEDRTGMWVEPINVMAVLGFLEQCSPVLTPGVAEVVGDLLLAHQREFAWWAANGRPTRDGQGPGPEQTPGWDWNHDPQALFPTLAKLADLAQRALVWRSRVD